MVMDNAAKTYRTRQSRIYNHLGWYLKESFNGTLSETQSISDIQEALAGFSGIKLRRETILAYNTRQFSLHQTSPLERIGEDVYRINENYYRLLKEKVFAPRVGKHGRRRKEYTQGDTEVNATS